MSDAIEVTTATTSKIYPPLEVPNSPPRLGLNDPGFEQLTTAEKLNDSNYRKLVYQTYPDEPTCACEPTTGRYSKISSNDESDVSKSSGNLLVCRSGCKRACCSSVRQSVVASSCRDNANKDDNVMPFMPTYCVANSRDNNNNRRKGYDEDECKKRKRIAHNGNYCGVENRLRGGGEGGEERRGEKGMYLHRYGEATTRTSAVRCYDDAWNGRNDCVVNRRLKGGGCGGCNSDGFEYVERYPLNKSTVSGSTKLCRNEENVHKGYPRSKYFDEQDEDSHLNTMNACASLPDSYPPIAPGCCCPGKENLAKSARQRTVSGKTCTKKPCPGVDCLVKAFRETQEFVDSLGKVPGLVGLGLMDPAESPYFGRLRRNESNIDEMGVTSSGLTGLPNPQCTGPCNSQMLKSTTGGYSIGATPFTIAVPGRGGVVREAVPTIPEPGITYLPGKWRKLDNKDKTKEPDPSVLLPIDIETGPCGEPRCKARRRKGIDDKGPEAVPIVKTDETETKRIVTVVPINDGRNSKTGSKTKGSIKLHSNRGLSPILGHAGSRNGKKMSSAKLGRRTISFVYSAGDKYTAPTCGHKYCIEKHHRVPGNMGWLWNVDQKIGRLKPRTGWKPGAIGRRIREIIRQAKVNFSHYRRLEQKSSKSSTRSRSTPSRGKRTKSPGGGGLVKKTHSRKREEKKDEIEPPPTLHIHRKDGTYYVTMYPIKEDTMDVPKLEEPMQPLQFKIAKNKDNASDASSSTASDMEIEFSPPAAVNRYHKKPNVVHVETQVKQQEIIDASKGDTISTGRSKKKGKKGKK